MATRLRGSLPANGAVSKQHPCRPFRFCRFGGLYCRAEASARASSGRCPFSNAFRAADQNPSTRQPDHLPFMKETQPWKMVMGLAPTSQEDWIEIDDDHVKEMRHRWKLLDERRDVVLQSLNSPFTRAAHQELIDWLLDHLPRAYPQRYKVTGSVVYNLATDQVLDIQQPGLDPLEAAGRLVQEDFAIMHHEPNQPVRLVSGCVCFPLHWTILAKLGQSIPQIHQDVPFFNSQIGRYVEAVFEKVPAGRALSRQNWTITLTPELHMVPGVREAAGHAMLPAAPESSAIALPVQPNGHPMQCADVRRPDNHSLLDTASNSWSKGNTGQQDSHATQNTAASSPAHAATPSSVAESAQVPCQSARLASNVLLGQGQGDLSPLSVANAGSQLYLRVERQHVHRLPSSDAVLFTIRTFVRPLGAVVADRPHVAASLAAAYRSLPEETLQYKSLVVQKEVALAYLDDAAAAKQA